MYDKYVDVNHKVSVNSDKRPLEEVLGELFAKTDIKYAVDGTYIVLSSKRQNSGEKRRFRKSLRVDEFTRLKPNWKETTQKKRISFMLNFQGT